MSNAHTYANSEKVLFRAFWSCQSLISEHITAPSDSPVE